MALEKRPNFTIIKYLDTPPSKKELQDILKRLSLLPSEFIRNKESIYAELGLENASEEELLSAMIAHPILIERPIVITDKGVRIGRPPEQVLEIL